MKAIVITKYGQPSDFEAVEYLATGHARAKVVITVEGDNKA